MKRLLDVEPRQSRIVFFPVLKTHKTAEAKKRLGMGGCSLTHAPAKQPCAHKHTHQRVRTHTQPHRRRGVNDVGGEGKKMSAAGWRSPVHCLFFLLCPVKLVAREREVKRESRVARGRRCLIHPFCCCCSGGTSTPPRKTQTFTRERAHSGDCFFFSALTTFFSKLTH